MSADAEAVSDALTSAATGPASASGDAGSVTQQPIPDLIQADQYFRAKDAATRAGRGLRFTRLVPDGTL